MSSKVSPNTSYSYKQLYEKVKKKNIRWMFIGRVMLFLFCSIFPWCFDEHRIIYQTVRFGHMLWISLDILCYWTSYARLQIKCKNKTYSNHGMFFLFWCCCKRLRKALLALTQKTSRIVVINESWHTYLIWIYRNVWIDCSSLCSTFYFSILYISPSIQPSILTFNVKKITSQYSRLWTIW